MYSTNQTRPILKSSSHHSPSLSSSSSSSSSTKIESKNYRNSSSCFFKENNNNNNNNNGNSKSDDDLLKWNHFNGNNKNNKHVRFQQLNCSPTSQMTPPNTRRININNMNLSNNTDNDHDDDQEKENKDILAMLSGLKLDFIPNWIDNSLSLSVTSRTEQQQQQQQQQQPIWSTMTSSSINSMPSLTRPTATSPSDFGTFSRQRSNTLPNPFTMFDPVWSFNLSNFNEQQQQNICQQQNSELEDKIERVAQRLRKDAKRVEANYHWSGHLPKKQRTKNPVYSCKVFLGGIPYDLTEDDLHIAFMNFGPITVQWPGKDVKSAIDGALAQKAGYVYIIFDNYDHVNLLLRNCVIKYLDGDSTCRWFFQISSRRCKGKEVQVIPFDIGDRFYMKGAFTGQMDHSKTVFVGALHGMLTAEGLAKVMDDLFGGVIFVGLDTDKFKYPLGSGRVAFDNHESYMKAVSAAFVEIKSSRFRKKIQIDPYIENESKCGVCQLPQSTSIFCRDMTCFRYYCRSCWDKFHQDKEMRDHRPLIKNKTN